METSKKLNYGSTACESIARRLRARVQELIADVSFGGLKRVASVLATVVILVLVPAHFSSGSRALLPREQARETLTLPAPLTMQRHLQLPPPLFAPFSPSQFDSLQSIRSTPFRAQPLLTAGRSPSPQGCGGACWNPHPGPFRWWYGQANGCWVQLWRQWQEGCTHYQMFNSCGNYFDPQIYWTCCVH
jgi:hypothetical protein